MVVALVLKAARTNVKVHLISNSLCVCVSVFLCVDKCGIVKFIRQAS